MKRSKIAKVLVNSKVVGFTLRDRKASHSHGNEGGGALAGGWTNRAEVK